MENNKPLYATLTLHGDPKLDVVDEIRLAIHDENDNLIFATYWETDKFTKEDITKAVQVLCAKYNVKELHTIEDIYDLEIVNDTGEIKRVFRTKKIKG